MLKLPRRESTPANYRATIACNREHDDYLDERAVAHRTCSKPGEGLRRCDHSLLLPPECPSERGERLHCGALYEPCYYESRVPVLVLVAEGAAAVDLHHFPTHGVAQDDDCDDA